ncbi:MAG TPA: hypothetical protein H9717_15830 [Candidatus Eisenbergiella merdipullorum]|uniref:GAT domain-containing protein n=1 Tax=Candidatus Eisenbergiella merdipullorum TaxID=2838553 RepID=A0A9D2I882_9FIRM|nr:hypothetical protein [Candidatus Eisenbergiella merdipullorum]
MSEFTEKPRWMQEPSLKDIPEEKLDFLQKMVFESKELSQKELLPFLMALAQRSRSANITFSTDEMNTIIEAIKKYSTPEELLKMNQIMKLMQRRK